MGMQMVQDESEFMAGIRTYVRERLTEAVGLTVDGRLPTMEDRLRAMAAQANRGCGQSYELFLERFSGMVDFAYPMGSYERDKAVKMAMAIGGYATPEELERSRDEMAEMGYCCHGLDPDCCPCGCGDID